MEKEARRARREVARDEKKQRAWGYAVEGWRRYAAGSRQLAAGRRQYRYSGDMPLLIAWMI
ncbi:MAG: hypothetical protein ACWGP1_07285 [Syntrophobacteria bacterium]